MRNIWIIEDDDNIRELVLYALGAAGFRGEGFTGINQCDDRLLTNPPTLLLLDIMLPGEDGISILRRIKQSEKTRSIAVIMLTAKGSEYDRVRGLDLGADDYITKPFSVMELISRINAVLRRCGLADAPNPEITVENITLNTAKRTVVTDGAGVALTYKEFELLTYLMLNEDLVLTREKLMEQVWGFDYEGESRTVDMHIKSLRQKLGDAGEIIKTVRGVGYKIEGK